MARARLPDIVTDAISDSGAVLWSIVKGEQIEYPVILNFIDDVTVAGYQYEAVVVEAANTANQRTKPKTIEPGGVQTTLTYRLPDYQGAWNSTSAYNYEEVVLYSGTYYKLTTGTGYINSVTPDLDDKWEETAMNIITIQFPSTLASTWNQAPIVDVPVYGFFELRVTEPTNAVYTRTWKPIRGMVEILFSPTDIVADI